jgi:hypothetical protein
MNTHGVVESSPKRHAAIDDEHEHRFAEYEHRFAEYERNPSQGR